ncbi:hypothetical protein [Anabaena sp. CCY 9614]|uniref:hypothetical protein n=1 Tax=Anabaena sp. CCY 9614 TaxID=3103869 RepID=UPI0039C746A3
MNPNKYSNLLKLAGKFLKYFLLAIFGVAIAYILSMSFGAVNMMISLLPLLGHVFSRLGILLLCFMTTTIIVESLR